MASDIQSILKARNEYADALLARFEIELSDMVAKAQRAVQAQLSQKLSLTRGRVDLKPGNMRILRSIDILFQRELDRLGFDLLLEGFVNEFPQQLPFLQQIIDFLSDQMKTPLPALSLNAKDEAVLMAQQTGTAVQLRDIVRYGAAVAKQRALLGIGALGFTDLVELMAEQFGVSQARAVTLADTAMNVFYRTANAQAFDAIEEEAPQRYDYAGPDDRLTRPFCNHLIQAGKSYTRAQIDRMDNGQLPDVFTTGGGYNCRHTWLLSIKGLEKRFEQEKRRGSKAKGAKRRRRRNAA